MLLFIRRTTFICLAVFLAVFGGLYYAVDCVIRQEVLYHLEYSRSWEYQEPEWEITQLEDRIANLKQGGGAAEDIAELRKRIQQIKDERPAREAAAKQRAKDQVRLVRTWQIVVGLVVLVLGTGFTYVVSIGLRWFLTAAWAGIKRAEDDLDVRSST